MPPVLTEIYHRVLSCNAMANVARRSRYVDLAWHLRQANDRATLWNVITQPRALQYFLEGGAKYEFLKWCRFCRPAEDDTYEAVLAQLLAEIESENSFSIDVVDRTARLAQEVGCHAQALQLFKQCNIHCHSEDVVADPTTSMAVSPSRDYLLSTVHCLLSMMCTIIAMRC